jgi:hypothetical protein
VSVCVCVCECEGVSVCGGGLSDVSLVEKYRMDDETYGEGVRECVCV